MDSQVPTELGGMLISSKQLISKVRELKTKAKYIKNLNLNKDSMLIYLTAQLRESNLNVAALEDKLRLNDDLVHSQAFVIEDLNVRVDRQATRIKELEHSCFELQSSVNSKHSTIQSLTSKLDEANKNIDDREFSNDQIKKKMYEMKQEFEKVKKVLKERYLERLELAAKEMDEEREKMNLKLRQTREFYDAEGNDYKRKINQLNEEVDLLRRADFNRPPEVPPPTRRRKRETTASKQKSGLVAPVRKSRPTGTKTKRTNNKKTEYSNEVIETSSQENARTVELIDQEETRSLSPMAWLTP